MNTLMRTTNYTNVGTASNDLLCQMISNSTLVLNVNQTSVFSVENAAKASHPCLLSPNTFNPTVPQGRLSNVSIVIESFLVHQAFVHTVEHTKVRILSSAHSARKPLVPYHNSGDIATHIANHYTIVTSLSPAKASQENNRTVIDHTSVHTAKRHLE